jgi:hypothetical protein
MTPLVEISDGQLIWCTITPSHQSLGQSVWGEFYCLHSWFTVADLCGTGKECQRTTIEILPKDILLNIFDFYQLDTIELFRGHPWKWYHLAHVCQKWWYVIFILPCHLDLQILCKYRVPIRSILGTWPTLPIVIEFDTTWKSKPMPRNILVALCCSNRICNINFSVTSSMTGSIIKLIQKLCLALKKIWLTVKDAMGPICIPVYNAFLGSSTLHLREIELHCHRLSEQG